MYPLQLKPIIKNYIWGGRRLIDEYGYKTDSDIAAEAWCLSCREGDENVVLNGEYEGQKLSRVPWIKKEGFPLLIKLIDAKRDLSVQVHPSRECASRHPGDSEKAEMWYIVDCDDGAELIRGFNEEFCKSALKERERNGTTYKEALADGLEKLIREDAVTDCCRRVAVRPGDVVFVEPGTLHAICRGIFLAEVQENSDTTYRVYDYGRIGADGKPRELHTEQALDAVRTASENVPVSDISVDEPYGKVRSFSIGDVSSSVVTLDGSLVIEDGVPRHLLVLAGGGSLEWEGGSLALVKGDSVLVPPCLRVTVKGTATLLSTPVRQA